ncbi:MAG: terminase family protein [Nitrososphaerota archaeon]
MRLALLRALDLDGVFNAEGARLEHFQWDFLLDIGRFRIDLKARQVGWSFVSALDAVLDALLIENYTAIFVSKNLEDAQEKIRYAHAILRHFDWKKAEEATGLDFGWLLHFEPRNAFFVKFPNGSRLISHPSNPPRGRAGSVYLDELAHCQRDYEIYQAALPMISRGGKKLRIGSTPLGDRGIFWEIYTQSVRKFAGFRRARIPWWSASFLCTHPQEATRAIEEEGVPIEEAVYRWGTAILKEIYGASVYEDFLQEYCCQFLSERGAFIPWELIVKAQAVEEVNYETGKVRSSLWYRVAKGVDEALRAPLALEEAIEQGKVGSSLYGGFDVGRVHDLSELALVEYRDGHIFYRLRVSLRGASFADQERILGLAMQKLPIASLWVDKTGIGMHLVERLVAAGGGLVRGVWFTNEVKTKVAHLAKKVFQDGKITIPPDSDLAQQIHSIEPRGGAGKWMKLDVKDRKGHHGDAFWALALALGAAMDGRSLRIEELEMPLKVMPQVSGIAQEYRPVPRAFVVPWGANKGFKGWV